jgi:hypothetical protein
MGPSLLPLGPSVITWGGVELCTPRGSFDFENLRRTSGPLKSGAHEKYIYSGEGFKRCEK